jgi:hypothetical protein
MRLEAKHVDMRGGYPEPGVFWVTDVVDLDSGKIIGSIRNETHPRSRHISLFDGKYVADFKSQQECDAFIKGVETVLDHATSFTEPKAAEQAA